MKLSVAQIEGNNFDTDSSMFWEGQFTDGRHFELSLRYGTVSLAITSKDLVIGHVSDFPNVADVLSLFENWVATDPDELK